MSDEKWLPIPGFPGYEASDQGNIRSVDRLIIRPGPKGNQRRKGVVLKVSIRRARSGTGTPYRTVTLYGPGGQKKPSQSVGVLVLTAHVGPRPPGMLMRHLDDNSLDDRLSNLAWGTYPENGRDAFINGHLRDRKGERHHKAKLNNAAVLEIRAAAAAGVNRTEIAKKYGVRRDTISDVVNRKTWNHLPEEEN